MVARLEPGLNNCRLWFSTDDECFECSENTKGMYAGKAKRKEICAAVFLSFYIIIVELSLEEGWMNFIFCCIYGTIIHTA